jgi:hypothetical protein
MCVCIYDDDDDDDVDDAVDDESVALSLSFTSSLFACGTYSISLFGCGKHHITCKYITGNWFTI